MRDLMETLVTAIADSINGQQQPGDRIAGYALVVDADMQTIYGTSVSQEFVEAESDDSFLFMPVDWPIEHHSEAFEHVSAQLVRTLEAAPDQGYDDHVRSVGDCFVSALKAARSRRPCLSRTLMLVICADGGPGAWHAVEEASVRRLNDASAYEKWTAEFGG